MITTDFFINTAITAAINGTFNSITVYFVYRYFLKPLDGDKVQHKKGFKPRKY